MHKIALKCKENLAKSCFFLLDFIYKVANSGNARLDLTHIKVCDKMIPYIV